MDTGRLERRRFYENVPQVDCRNDLQPPNTRARVHAHVRKLQSDFGEKHAQKNVTFVGHPHLSLQKKDIKGGKNFSKDVTANLRWMRYLLYKRRCRRNRMFSVMDQYLRQERILTVWQQQTYGSQDENFKNGPARPPFKLHKARSRKKTFVTGWLHPTARASGDLRSDLRARCGQTRHDGKRQLRKHQSVRTIKIERQTLQFLQESQRGTCLKISQKKLPRVTVAKWTKEDTTEQNI